MPWTTLRKILFSCCGASDEIQETYDESSHLIPSESVQPPVIYSNVGLLDHQKVRERLGLIVRAKESKMVNVASQIPFNLHNQVLSPERSYGSVSRSASGSIDQHSRDHDYRTDYGYSIHGIARQRNFYVSTYDNIQADRSRSASPSAGPTVGPSSQTLDHAKPTPILNVRLVGYTDNMCQTRGRARERQSQSIDMPDVTDATTRVEDEGVSTRGNAETSCEGLPIASTFKLRDVGSITLNWND